MPLIVTVAVVRILQYLFEKVPGEMEAKVGKVYVRFTLLLTPDATVQPLTVSVLTKVVAVDVAVQMNHW